MLVRLAALCRGEKAENRNLEAVEGTELNGVDEGADGMSAGDGDRIDGEKELAPPDGRVRAEHRNKPSQKEREEHEATHVPHRDWCRTLHDGQRADPSARHQTKRARISREVPPSR